MSAVVSAGYHRYKQCKDYTDMSEDMLRRSRILVVCGTAVDETVLTDIAIANRFHVASSTMRGVLGVDKNKKEE